MIVSNVRYLDGEKLRSILYEGSLSEMFVPYMDPDVAWYARTFFDAGEFADGFSSSLDQGGDCPENAVYFDQIYADHKGIPQLKPRAACLFEQSTGDMAWRHDGKVVESRRARDLVLRTIGTFGNYDYVFDWTFQQDGTIRVRAGATGLDEVKGAKGRTAADDPEVREDTYGRFIAENTVGVDHDHYFSFRLDFDVDGTANSFVRDGLSAKRLADQLSPEESVGGGATSSENGTASEGADEYGTAGDLESDQSERSQLAWLSGGLRTDAGGQRHVLAAA